MDLNPIDIKEAANKQVQREGEPAIDEVDEADALTVAWDGNGVLSRRACLHLLQGGKEALLAQIIKILRLDGGLPPVAVHFLQAGILLRSLTRRVLAALGRGFLPHDRWEQSFCGVGNGARARGRR